MALFLSMAMLNRVVALMPYSVSAQEHYAGDVFVDSISRSIGHYRARFHFHAQDFPNQTSFKVSPFCGQIMYSMNLLSNSSWLSWVLFKTKTDGFQFSAFTTL